jgi:Putative Ig domain
VGPYSWSAVGLPPDLTLDASTGQTTGTPTQPGSYTVTITANDSQATPSQVSPDYVIDVVKP